MGKWKSDKMVDRYAHLNVEHLRPHSDALGNMLGGVTSSDPPAESPVCWGNSGGSKVECKLSCCIPR